MANRTYQVGLTISHHVKGIPYGGYRNGELNDDGTAKNCGFKNLKGRPELLHEVPELLDNWALYELAEAINKPENGLVSVGCAGWDMSDDNGHRWHGYIEFAINSAEMIADSKCYFPLFFHFDRMLHNEDFNQRVNYNWELAGAHFAPANVDGFTCAVNVYTPYASSIEDAKEAWQQAIVPLIVFLGGYPAQEGTPLFTSETSSELE